MKKYILLDYEVIIFGMPKYPISTSTNSKTQIRRIAILY